MMTTTELAAALDTTPRTLRKFLRSTESGIESVGKGARYALPSTKRDIKALTKRFTAWGEAIEAKKVEKDAAAPEVDDAPADELIDDADTDYAPTLDEMHCPLDD